METRIADHETRISRAHHIGHQAHTLATAASPTATGAISQVSSGNFGYAATTTSITIYWDGTNSSTAFVMHLSDGTTIAVPKASIAVTGLTAGTSYKFYPYYSVDAAEMVFCVGGTGTPAVAFTSASTACAAIQILDGNLPLINGSVTFATPGSGTGGGTGGGGSGCLAGWVLVGTPDGIKRIDECKEGDIILAPQGWTEIRFLKRHLAERLITVTTKNGHQIHCTETHPLALLNERWCVPEATLGKELVTLSGPSKVIDVTVENDKFVAYHPGCEPYHEFWSNGILTHNVMYEK
jgi:hypothetical protein